MGSKTFFILSILFIAMEGTIFAQDWYSYLKKDGPELKLIQHISWEAEEYAGRYEVSIEKEGNGGTYTEVYRESTENAYIETSLESGKYRYRIRVYDLLDRPQGDPAWEHFNVQIALRPEILTLNPKEFDLNEDTLWRITLTGQNLIDGTEAFLRRRGNRKDILPVEIRVNESAQTIELNFTAGQLTAGNYDLYIKGPGGLETFRSGLRVDYEGKVDFAVSLGYAPMIPLYGKFFEVFDKAIDPLGAYARLSVIPLKKTWGYLGAELEPFWNYLDSSNGEYEASSHISGGHINVLYQRRLPNRIMAVNLRLGGGISSMTDYRYKYGSSDSETLLAYYVSAGGGASFLWYPVRHFFLELGFEFNHILTIKDTPQQGYIRPMIGAGARF
ncbi:hypothetical protein AGMMS50268_25480 [Spirochaetia bacterium]|nr:hypothetical protein AGMMS50268_25480 [Spirochaetia bacterium]